MVRKPDKTQILHGGEQKLYSFANGYGASVIRHSSSYGGDRGLWELAVLNPDGSIAYNTPVTSDVIGYLNDEDVEKHLNEIEALPKAGSEPVVEAEKEPEEPEITGKRYRITGFTGNSSQPEEGLDMTVENAIRLAIDVYIANEAKKNIQVVDVATGEVVARLYKI